MLGRSVKLLLKLFSPMEATLKLPPGKIGQHFAQHYLLLSLGDLTLDVKVQLRIVRLLLLPLSALVLGPP